jgi:hypothetical protein
MVLNTVADRTLDVQGQVTDLHKWVRGDDPNITLLLTLLNGLSEIRNENARIIARLDALTAKP